MKKTISLIICTVLLSSIFVFPVNGAARTDTNYGNWIGYENSDGTLTITGCRALSEFLDNIIEIPETVEGKKVTGIGLYCGESSFYVFSHPYEIKSIILPDTIEYVEPRLEDSWPYTSVFGSYTDLEEIVLPNNKNFDRDDADNLFNRNNKLEKLRSISSYDSDQLGGIERSVLTTSSSNFASLEEVTFTAPDAEEIDFYGDDKYPLLKTININSATRVRLDNLDIDELNISKDADVRKLEINSLNNLETLDIPESVRKLELSYCKSLKEVNYQGDIKNLSVETLYECPNVNMPVVYVRYYEDYECTAPLGSDWRASTFVNSKIQEIHIDSQRLGEDMYYNRDTSAAFRKMPALKRIVINGEHPLFYTQDDVLYLRSGEYNQLIAYPAAKSNGGNYNLPKDVTFICCYAFECSKLDTITIPEKTSELYEWDNFFDQDEYNEDYDEYGRYVIITDFFDGKIRMAENSTAYENWVWGDSKVILYTGESTADNSEPATEKPETTDSTVEPVTEKPEETFPTAEPVSEENPFATTEPVTEDHEVTNPTAESVTEESEITDSTGADSSEQQTNSTEATESTFDETSIEETTDKPVESIETTAPSGDTQIFKYLPSKEQLESGNTIKLVVKDTDGQYYTVEMTATPEIYDGASVYTATLPADITPELVQFQIYHDGDWKSQVSLTAEQYISLKGALITSEGKAYGGEQQTTAQPKPSQQTVSSDKAKNTVTVTAKKSANTIKVKVKKKTVSARKLKKRKITVKALYVTNAKGKVTYSKEFSDSALKVNKTTGKITVKKGTKKGTYSTYVIIKAKGNSKYKSKKISKLVIVKVK